MKKHLSLRLPRRAFAGLTFAVMMAVGTVQADDKLTMSYPGKPEGTWGELSRKMADDVKVRGLIIESFAESELGGPKQAVEGLLTNVIDIAFLSGYHLAERIRGFEVLNFPLLAVNLEEVQQIIAAVGPDLVAQADKSGLRVLGYTWLVGTFISAEKCVVHPSDLKGAKVIDGPRYHQLLVESVGGVPVALAAAEYYAAMQVGISQTGLFSIPLILEIGLHEATDCITDPSEVAVMLVPVVLAMNKQRFDSLLDEVKMSIREAATATEAEAEKRLQALIDEALSRYSGEGKRAETISREALDAWREAANELNSKLANELGLEDLYAKALAARSKK